MKSAIDAIPNNKDLVRTLSNHGASSRLGSCSRTSTCTRCLVVTLLTETDSNGLIVMYVNDPSAGSPTETLLRLLLPLNGKV